MKIKLVMFLAVLIVPLTAVAVEEYDALAFTAKGEMIKGSFLRQDDYKVIMRVEGQLYEYPSNDLAVVIFDNNYTNFYRDRDSQTSADPNLVILKQNAHVSGRVTSVVPGERIVIQRRDGVVSYNTHDVARIYYNPRPLFALAEITGNNTLKLPEPEEETGGDDDKGGDKKRGGGKDRDKKDPGKNKNKKKPKPAERLAGGEVFIRMKGGATTRGLIYDAQGRNLELILRDGRKFLVNNIDIINYVEVKNNYPKDKNLIRPGGATFIMRNGGTAYGVVLDYRGDGEWELADGRRLRWNQIARIYFR